MVKLYPSLNKSSILLHPAFAITTKTVINIVLFTHSYHLNDFFFNPLLEQGKKFIETQHTQSVCIRHMMTCPPHPL